jgi:hypothetical protein
MSAIHFRENWHPPNILKKNSQEYFIRKCKKTLLQNLNLTILRTFIRTCLRNFYEYTPEGGLYKSSCDDLTIILKPGVPQSCFNKVGHLLVCKQIKRGWELQIFYSYFVMSQLYETKIQLL